MQDFYFKKLWITKRNFIRRNLLEEKEKRKRNLLEERNNENKSNLKELWIMWRSLGIPSEVEGSLNIIIREWCSLLWFNKSNLESKPRKNIISSRGIITKASATDQIFAKFLKDGAPATATYLINISLSISLVTFPPKMQNKTNV